MSIQNAFAVLGIEMTKEEDQIRNAYRGLLGTVNPEEDAEGFKRLRAAYEEALAYAAEPEEGQEITEAEWMDEKGPAGAFYRRLADVYTFLPRRIMTEEWDSLLQDPVFESLDEGEQVKWGLFSYLSDHFRLPCSIWRLLDRIFFIRENAQEFKEHLPEGFVDFMIYKIEDESGSSEFPYELFGGKPDADYDGFLNEYGELEEESGDPEKLERAGERIRTMEAYGITHPWYDLERAGYLLKTGEKEAAQQLVEGLLQEYPEDEKIRLNGARTLAECGREEEARAVYEEYLEQEKQTDWGRYRAKLGLAELEAAAENWEKVLDLAEEAGYRTPRLQALTENANRELITKYLSKESTLTQEEAHRLGWCFIDSQREKEGREFFARHPEFYEDKARCHKRMAIIYLMTDAKEALKETALWRACMEREKAEECPEQEGEDNASGEKEAEQKREEAQCWHVEGRALRLLYVKELEKNGADSAKAEELADRGMQAYAKCEELAPEDAGFMIHKVLLLRDRKNWEAVIAACEKILELDSQSFWACYYMQEAYEEQRMGQEVIDTFYRAKEIYAGHPDIYVRALRVFRSYGQYNDALSILRQAEEAGVEDARLSIEKIGVLEKLVENEEDWKKADEYAAEVIEKLEKEETPAEQLAEAYLKRAWLNDSGDEYVGTKGQGMDLVYAQKSLELSDTMMARYCLGRYYINFADKAEEAYQHLKICEERGMTYEWMYFFIARCHEEFSHWDEAIRYYKKATEENPNATDCYWRIAWLYRHKFYRTGHPEYADLALQYEDLQVEKCGESASTYRWKAVIYQRLGQFDKALETVNKGLEMDRDCGLLFRKGDILRMLRKYEEAIDYLEQSLREEDRYGECDEECLYTIFKCFLRIRRLEEGIRWFEEKLEQVSGDELKKKCMNCLSDLEAEAGRCDRALMWKEKEYGALSGEAPAGKDWSKAAEQLHELLCIWIDFQPYEDEDVRRKLRPVEELAGKALRDVDADSNARAAYLKAAGDAYFFLADYDKALSYLENALKLADGNFDGRKNLLSRLMKNCYWAGDRKAAQKYGEQFYRELEKEMEECGDLGMPVEELLVRPGYGAKQRMYELFNYAYHTGQYGRAAEYAEQMNAMDMCSWCDEDDCSEIWEIRGLMAYLVGRKKEARKDFKNCNDYSWLGGDLLAKMILKRIEGERKENDNRN